MIQGNINRVLSLAALLGSQYKRVVDAREAETKRVETQKAKEAEKAAQIEAKKREEKNRKARERSAKAREAKRKADEELQAKHEEFRRTFLTGTPSEHILWDSMGQVHKKVSGSYSEKKES
jgi:Skp family chaperone for outer membrane proteins